MTRTRLGSGSLAALRGPLVTFTGEPAHEGPSALRYEPDAIVTMAGGRIVAAGPARAVLRALPQGTPVENCGRDALILPGFVDCHVHLSAVAGHRQLRRATARLARTLYVPGRNAVRGRSLCARVARRYLAENLRHGVTTAAVFCTAHPQSVDAFFTEAAALGMRMIAGKALMDRHAPRALRDTARRGYDESKALIARWHGKGRLGYAITPRYAPTSTPAQLEAAGALWREHPHCWVQSHVSENRLEVAWAKELFPAARDYVDVYARFGLLGRRAIYGHGIHLTEREWRALHESGTALAHCPTSNLFLGSGLFRWDRARKATRPVRVGLGTDVGGGTSLSMLQTLSEAYKVAQMGGHSLSAAQAFWLATQGGAAALDLDDRIGRVAPGFDADLIVLDLKSTPLIAQRMDYVRDIEEALFVQMTLGDDRAISSTWIAGRCAYRKELRG
jgi:guanine deaminase